jgi:hypothetical protein
VFVPTLGELATAYDTPSGITGDWVIELPPHVPLKPSELADALKRSAVSFSRRGAELTLQIGDLAELAGTPDATNQRLKVERTISRPTNLSRPQGYLGPCRLSVTKSIHPEAGKGRRGGGKRKK